MALGSSEKLSLKYHNIFDYPLTKKELSIWKINTKSSDKQLKRLLKDASKIKVDFKNGFYFLTGRSEIIKKRLQKQKYSQEKLKIAKRAAKLISKIPYIKFIGITGALAMNNAGQNSDVDLMVITQNHRLWTTRLLGYLLLKIAGYHIRKPGNRREKNQLCINLWLSEDDLVWGKDDRNIYTAHEIVQVTPLINKDQTYEKFVLKNSWVNNYWINSIAVKRIQKTSSTTNTSIIEKVLFRLQYFYMQPKITREVVTEKKGLFHPNDWGRTVLDRLST